MASRADGVVDTSALMAILLGEPDALSYLETLGRGDVWWLSAATRTEVLIVTAARLSPDVPVSDFLRQQNIHTVPVDEALADAAADAWRRYGKGRHPAGLNFGDCFSYALARQTKLPLLFKGDDFAQTDVAVVPVRA